MRGVSKQHQPLNIRELVPEGTPAPPQAVPLSAALTLTYRRLPVSNSTVIASMGNHVRGEKTSKPSYKQHMEGVGSVLVVLRLHAGALDTPSPTEE